jgi:hypothetical protein
VRRRRTVLAIAALAVVLVVVLVAVLSGGNGKKTTTNTGTPTGPRATTDPHAADRAAIQRTAISYQRALKPGSNDNPCNHLSSYAKAQLRALATPPSLQDAPCARKARAVDAGPLGRHLSRARMLGVTRIVFGPFRDLARKSANAAALWRHPGQNSTTGGQALFVHRRGRWLIEVP